MSRSQHDSGADTPDASSPPAAAAQVRANWYSRHFGWIPRPVRAAVVGVIGGTVLLLGIIMMVTPGPAIIVIPVGLAILALEFTWATRWLLKLKRAARNVGNRVRTGMGKGPRGGVAAAADVPRMATDAGSRLPKPAAAAGEGAPESGTQ